MHFNNQVAQQQQAAAQALALSGILPPFMQSAFPNPSSLPLKHGPVSSTSAIAAPLAAPPRVKVGCVVVQDLKLNHQREPCHVLVDSQELSALKILDGYLRWLLVYMD